MDKRLNALTKWINSRFNTFEPILSPASVDASFRRYFRVEVNNRSYIVMDAPPELEDIEPFIKAAQRFLEIGLNVPEIIAVDRNQGFVLLTDLGTTTYLDCLDKDNADRLYGDALDALVVLQTGTFTDPNYFPAYDRSLLMGEMALFPQWYVQRHINQSLDSKQQTVVEDTFDLLCDSALEQPKVWVHRDYHSRNLMPTKHNNPGILDFQDAVTGPITYDLVSLLRDCYIKWPQQRVYEWALGYQTLATQSGLPLNINEEQFIKWFDYMGVQRHIKVLGIFARLYYRDGKSNYLNDLPMVWEYLVTVCQTYQDLHPFRELLMNMRPKSCTQ
ncbi:MAG: phosphotransferase [Arenicellales bacterium]|nr:phosphotransferase [Arenicellales bacterium]